MAIHHKTLSRFMHLIVVLHKSKSRFKHQSVVYLEMMSRLPHLGGPPKDMLKAYTEVNAMSVEYTKDRELSIKKGGN